MISDDGFKYLKHVILNTLDGLYAGILSLLYLLIGVSAYFEIIDLPIELDSNNDAIGIVLMSILLLLVHVWHRSGVPCQRKFHLPSIIGVSIFAFLVPLIRLDVF